MTLIVMLVVPGVQRGAPADVLPGVNPGTPSGAHADSPCTVPTDRLEEDMTGISELERPYDGQLGE